MKRFIAMLLLALLLTALSGCAKEEGGAQNGVQNQKNIHIVTESITNDELFTERLKLSGLDEEGNAVWVYQTHDCALTELAVVEYIGEQNGLVYVNEQNWADPSTGELLSEDGGNGGLVALDKQTGEVVWQNTDFTGAGVFSAFDEKGTLYIGGYYGPDCMAIAGDGSTLWQCEAAYDELYWPYELELKEGKIEVHYEGGDYPGEYGVAYLSAEDGTVCG